MRIKKTDLPSQPTERARKWAGKLSYTDRLAVRELMFRLYAISEELRIERSKGRNNGKKETP